MHTNEIGLKKISENSFEITPCEVQFAGFTVTIGNGIKRNFPELSLIFKDPCDKYIEQFFSLEVKSVFVPSENPVLFAQFIEDSNKFYCRYLYVLAFKLCAEKLYNNPFEKISLEEDSQLCDIHAKLEPSLEKIQVFGQSNLSLGEKMRVFSAVHDTVCTFISHLLVATNQIDFKLTSKVITQQLHLDLASGSTSAAFITSKAMSTMDKK